MLAAASLQEALNEAADAWAAQGHARPTLSFAASSALARQVQSGAPADILISADQAWMDQVEKGGHIQRGSRRNLLRNSLVLIAPAGGSGVLAATQESILAAVGNGRIAIADPDSVPAGRYSKAALTKLGLWGPMEKRLARADSVRAALALVERGEAPLGVVYATDARAEKDVRVLASFPPGTHPSIIYPIALLKGSAREEARGFHAFLLSPQAQAIFARYGFLGPPP